MPAVRAKGRSKKAVNKAVGANMRTLTKVNKTRSKPRSRAQMIAIAESEAKGGKHGKRR